MESLHANVSWSYTPCSPCNNPFSGDSSSWNIFLKSKSPILTSQTKNFFQQPSWLTHLVGHIPDPRESLYLCPLTPVCLPERGMSNKTSGGFGVKRVSRTEDVTVGLRPLY